MKALHASDLFQSFVQLSKDYREAVLRGSTEYVTSVVVVETIEGPSGGRVPCGQSSYPRCHADQFKVGELTITAMDDGYEVRVYAPGTWAECTVYGPDGHISYGWIAGASQ